MKKIGFVLHGTFDRLSKNLAEEGLEQERALGIYDAHLRKSSCSSCHNHFELHVR